MFEERPLLTQRYNGSFIAEQFASRTLYFVLTIPLGIHSFLNVATRREELLSSDQNNYIEIIIDRNNYTEIIIDRNKPNSIQSTSN